MKISQKLKSSLALFSAALTLSGTAAHAGPGSASGSNWTGFYAGAFVGTVFGTNKFEERSVTAKANSGTWENTPAGVNLGYNFEITRNIIIGAEADYTFNKIKADGSNSATFNCAGICRATVDNFATVRARVGLDFGKLLAFGTVGYGRGKARGSFPNFAGAAGGSNTLSGVVWGFGLEYLITNNLSIKGEYLNTDLGRLELPTACSTNCFTDINFQTARIGLNYRF